VRRLARDLYQLLAVDVVRLEEVLLLQRLPQRLVVDASLQQAVRVESTSLLTGVRTGHYGIPCQHMGGPVSRAAWVSAAGRQASNVI
jgi:hypothetical protein